MKQAKNLHRRGAIVLGALIGGVTGGTLAVAVPQAAQAAMPLTRVVLPANSATVSGAQVMLDSTAPARLNGFGVIRFLLSGGPSNRAPSLVATATSATSNGWITTFDSKTIPNGTYRLQSDVCIFAGCNLLGPATTITINNPSPTSTVLATANNPNRHHRLAR